MDFSLSNILHIIGQALLTPCKIVLISLAVLSVWQAGELIAEYFTERRKTERDVPALLKRFHNEGAGRIVDVVNESSLLVRHKKALIMLISAENMPKTSLTALAQRLLATEEDYYERNVSIADMCAKLGPMFGLLGTLIPLGPGVVALGRGDTALLAESIGLAFDTTILGVASAAVCSVISKIRKRWYNDYMVTLESVMDCILEEVPCND